MKVGDVVRVADCPAYTRGECECVFCFYDSNRIGVVKKQEDYRRGCQMWIVQFDWGVWELANDEAEVISEAG